MMKKHQSLFLITITLLSLSTHASQGDRYYQEVESAKNSINQSLNSSAFNSFDEESYCSDAACVAEMNNPSQKDYFGNDNKMVDDGMIGLANDPNAANVVTGFNDRPKYDIDPNDPALRRAKGYMDDSYNISHGISSKYHDCDDGSVCIFDPTQKVCSEPTGLMPFCESIPYVKGSTSTKDSIEKKIRYPGSIAIPNDSSVHRIDVPAFTSSTFSSHKGNVTKYLTVNGRNIKAVTFFYTGHDWLWANHRTNAFSVNVNLPTGQTSVNLSFTSLPDILSTSGNTILHIERKANEMAWRDNCSAAPTECAQKKPICIEGGGTRMINGIATYMSCWKKRIDLQCEFPNTCNNFIPPASRTKFSIQKSLSNEITECVESEKTCAISVFGVCLSNDVTLDCKEKKCEQIGLTCGEESFCLDGDCYNPPPQPNEDFEESAAALAALGAAAANLNEDSLTIFSGEAAFCSKKPIGLSDCCADDGWGNDIGLTACSEEEKGLAEAKKDGLTVSLGEFCAEDVLGACIRKKKSYCQFDSKMSRIVQEQGRPQLGMNFGSKKSPNCNGITPEQLSQLDFSTIDFSDFYEDMQSNMELPDMDKVQESIVDKFEDMQK